MNTELKILVVDDEPFNLDIMGEYLEPHYSNVSFAKNGQECLNQISQSEPDIVLLDVSMPGLNGYEVCERIKERNSKISVVFVSARGSAEERLKGYEVGGDDYVIKPFQEEEIFRKINGIIEHRANLQELESRLSEAEDTAFEAMINNSELGLVIGLLNELFLQGDIDSILQRLHTFLTSLNLKCVSMIKIKDQVQFYNGSNSVVPLEQDLMTLLATEGRIFSHNTRCQINYPNISVLIKNMPIEDDAKMGRYRDSILFALNGADNCVKTLSYKSDAEQKIELAKTIENIDLTVRSGLKNLTVLQDKCEQASTTLNVLLDEKIPFMGLDDDQEELVISASHNVIDVMNDALKGLNEMSVKLQNIKKS